MRLFQLWMALAALAVDLVKGRQSVGGFAPLEIALVADQAWALEQMIRQGDCLFCCIEHC